MGIIGRDEYFSLRERYDAQLAQLSEDLEQLEKGLAALEAQIKKIQAVRRDAQSIRKDRVLTAELIDRLIERIDITTEKHIAVTFKFQSEAAEVVRLIFQLSADGVNAAEITRELYRRGIPTPGEYKAAHGNHTHDISRTHGIWNSSTVLRMLEDERYIGTYVIGKRAVLEVGGTHSRMKDRSKWFIIPDHHPAIVDQDTFERSKAKQTRYPQANKKKRDYPLKGKIFCGCCDHALSRTFQKTSYYFCRHSDADKSKPCYKMRYEATALEEAVFQSLKTQMEVLGAEDFNSMALAKAAVSQRPEYERQIEELEDGKLHLYEQYQLREIDLLTYKAQKEKLDAMLLKTKNAYAALTAQAKREQEEAEKQAQRKSISKELTEATGLTTALADLLIDRVRLYPGGRIEIEYKMQHLFE